MKTIIAATDFSPASKTAAQYAAQMAQAIKGDLFLLHTYEIPVSFSEVAVLVDPERMAFDAEMQMAELEYELQILTNDTLPITTQVKLTGFFEQLESVCQELTPYAVVLGSKGATALQRIVFGSNTLYTVRHLQWPVLTVPEGCQFMAMKKIAIVCDFDNIDDIPKDEIRMLVNNQEAELHILDYGSKKSYIRGFVHEASDLLGIFEPIRIEFHYISGADEDKIILDFVEDNSIDLLIVIPKRQNLLESLIKRNFLNILFYIAIFL